MMKITYLANVRLPTEKAHGAQIMAMSEALALAGAEVSLVVPKRYNVIKDDPFAYYGAKKNFTLTHLGGGNFPAFKPEKLNHFLNSLWFPLRAMFSGELTGDIIYTRDSWTVFILSLAGYSVIYEDHGWPKNQALYKLCVKKARGVVALTQGVANQYDKNNLSLPVLVAHDGIWATVLRRQISKEEARQQLDLSLTDQLAVYTGSLGLYDWKGVDVFLETAALMPEVKVVVVGGWPKEISTLKSKFPAANIIFVGQQDKAVVRVWQAAADVLVLPNKAGSPHSELYTSPLKLFEYMAAKRPIVASDLTSIREVLNEDNAFLVEPNNSAALKEGIKEALNSPQAGEKTRQALIEVSNYTWENRAKEVVTFIKTLIN